MCGIVVSKSMTSWCLPTDGNVKRNSWGSRNNHRQQGRKSLDGENIQTIFSKPAWTFFRDDAGIVMMSGGGWWVVGRLRLLSKHRNGNVVILFVACYQQQVEDVLLVFPRSRMRRCAYLFRIASVNGYSFHSWLVFLYPYGFFGLWNVVYSALQFVVILLILIRYFFAVFVESSACFRENWDFNRYSLFLLDQINNCWIFI